jgi:acetyl esterase/lipase
MSSFPIGYLIPALLLAWCTYYVVAPGGWPRFPRSLGYYFIVVNELPFLPILWLAGSTWLAWSQGDIFSPVGWLAFGLSVLTTIGLVAVIYWGLQTAPAINRALDKGLGKGWRTAIDPNLATRSRSRFAPSALLGPFAIRRWNVEHLANISYGEAGKYHLLDLYRQRSQPAHAPVLIHFHSGAFVGGKKNHDALPLLYRLASHGWVCISANYRLSPAVTLPGQLSDAKRVIAWVRAHGVEYGANPDMLYVAGNSAGATLAALAALTFSDPRLQPGFEDANTSVSGAILLYGFYDWPDTTNAWSPAGRERNVLPPASPLPRASKDAPPFFVLHGDRDTTLPAGSARLFAQNLRSISHSPVVYAELPGAEHNFDLFHSIRAESVINGVEAFLAWVQTAMRSIEREAVNPSQEFRHDFPR